MEIVRRKWQEITLSVLFDNIKTYKYDKMWSFHK